MDREIFIETISITHEETQAFSIGGRKGKKEEEEAIETEDKEEKNDEGEGEKQGTKKENPKGPSKPQEIEKQEQQTSLSPCNTFFKQINYLSFNCQPKGFVKLAKHACTIYARN